VDGRQPSTKQVEARLLKKSALPVSLILAFLVSAVLPSVAIAWTPVGQATVHPGVQVFTDGAQCTSNFVFEGGAEVFLGQAAHCSGTGGQTETDGCTSPSLPLGTPVEITGASRPGTLVYNSWLAMQADGETDPDACAYNDFALIRVDPVDVAEVNPSIPGFGGPTGIGWSHGVVMLTPGIPGDSGSGFLNASGAAFGVLSTLQLAPLAGSNGIGDLGRELAYMRTHSALTTVRLVPGTQPFKANFVEAIIGS
jgi:hypothetical protein